MPNGDEVALDLESALKNIGSSPATANDEGQRLLTQGKQGLRGLLIGSSPFYAGVKDLLAAGVMQCAVAYGNETSKWSPCISLLEGAIAIASDPSLRERLNHNLAVARTNHESLGSP